MKVSRLVNDDAVVLNKRELEVILIGMSEIKEKHYG